MHSKFRFDYIQQKSKERKKQNTATQNKTKNGDEEGKNKNWKLKWLIKSEITSNHILFKKRNQGALKFGKLLDYKKCNSKCFGHQ